MNDQASALRQLVFRKREAMPSGNSGCEIISVTSGKGGVGKSNITMNTALAMAANGAKVLILDADIGTANIDILVGLSPRKHLGHVFEGEATLFEIMTKITDNLYLIPGSSGVSGIREMPFDQLSTFREEILKIEDMFEYLIVDTSAGVSKQVINLLRGSDRILLVCNEEPTSILDAYSLCKVLYQVEDSAEVEFVANNVASEVEAREVYGKLRVAIKHFLNKELKYLSFVVHDKGIANGVINQKPLMIQDAPGPARASFTRLAELLMHPDGWATGRGIHQLFNLLVEK